MQRTYWPTWKTFLSRWGLISPACDLLALNQSLINLAAQMMYMGLPLFKGAGMGSSYGALLDLLGDEDSLSQFADYLQEAGA